MTANDPCTRCRNFGEKSADAHSPARNGLKRVFKGAGRCETTLRFLALQRPIFSVASKDRLPLLNFPDEPAKDLMINLHLLPAWLNGRVLFFLLPIVAVGALGGALRLLAKTPRQAHPKLPRPGRAHWLP